MNRVTTPKLPPPPLSAQNRSAFSFAVGRAHLAVRGDDLDLLEIVDRPAEPTRQVAEAAAERQAGHADLGDEAEHGRQPVLLRRAVDVLEQTPGPDVREPGVGVDRDLAHAGHVERQAALGDRGAGDVVTAALDAEQQPVVTRERDGRGDVAGRGRLDDERRDHGDHAVPDQHGVVPALVPRAQQGAVERSVEIVELVRRERGVSALACRDVECARRS